MYTEAAAAARQQLQQEAARSQRLLSESNTALAQLQAWVRVLLAENASLTERATPQRPQHSRHGGSTSNTSIVSTAPTTTAAITTPDASSSTGAQSSALVSAGRSAGTVADTDGHDDSGVAPTPDPTPSVRGSVPGSGSEHRHDDSGRPHTQHAADLGVAMSMMSGVAMSMMSMSDRRGRAPQSGSTTKRVQFATPPATTPSPLGRGDVWATPSPAFVIHGRPFKHMSTPL